VRHLLRGQTLLLRRRGHLMRKARQVLGLAVDEADGRDGGGSVGPDGGIVQSVRESPVRLTAGRFFM